LQTYETTIVVDSLQKAEDVQTSVDKIETFIKNHGGNILKREDWGKKRLAYEINRKQYGTYVHFVYEAPSSMPGLIEGEFRLEEKILRYLTVAADSNLASEAEQDQVQQVEVASESADAETTESEPVAEASGEAASNDGDPVNTQETAVGDSDTAEVASAPPEEQTTPKE